MIKELQKANIQAMTDKAYETKIQKFLEKQGHTVLRFDYENANPDYAVITQNSIEFLELKNYRGCQTATQAINQTLNTENKKRMTKDRKKLLKAGIITCVAYNGDSTLIIKNRSSGVEFLSPASLSKAFLTETKCD